MQRCSRVRVLDVESRGAIVLLQVRKLELGLGGCGLSPGGAEQMASKLPETLKELESSHKAFSLLPEELP